jgi:CheY-like chemotaxis protein
MSEVRVPVVRVLVVDDQLAYRRALAAVVTETDGFAMVASTTSGEESLAIAAEVLPDLVLMDVNLPGISGIDAARRLTATPGGPVVVLLSTYDEDEFDLEGCGASAYVAKATFGPDRLSELWSEATG